MALSECGACDGAGDCRFMDTARASVPSGAVEDLPSSAEDSLAGDGDSETVSDASNAPPSTMAALNSKGKAQSRVSGKERPRGTPEGKAKAEPKAKAKTKGKAEKKATAKCKALVKSVDVEDQCVRRAAAIPEPLPDGRPAKAARCRSEPKDTCAATPSSSIMGTPLCEASTPAPLKRIWTPPPVRDTRESSAGSDSESSTESSSGSSDASNLLRPPASGPARVAPLPHPDVAALHVSP